MSRQVQGQATGQLADTQVAFLEMLLGLKVTYRYLVSAWGLTKEALLQLSCDATYYSILYLHPIDHYNDKGHVTRNNIQYISRLTDILAMYGIIT
jgi:hypothetical protein